MANKKRLKSLFRIIPFIVVLLMCNFSTYAEQRIDVDIQIKSYEVQDAFVVGDFFYYWINLTNTGSEVINTTFDISLFSPSRVLIEIPRFYQENIEPSNSVIIEAKGGKANETALFPFDFQGDYMITLSSNIPIDLYRQIEIRKSEMITRRYIRQNTILTYYFDVMPRWQYTLWKNSESANNKAFEANEKLLSLTIDLKDLTADLKKLTWYMLAIAFFALWMALVSFKGKDKLKLKYIFWSVIGLLILDTLISIFLLQLPSWKEGYLLFHPSSDFIIVNNFCFYILFLCLMGIVIYLYRKLK